MKTTYYVEQKKIEKNALEQINTTESFDTINKIAVYPDIHYCAEKAIPVGLAFSTKDVIFPLITGKDVGCGVAYLKIPKTKYIKPFNKEHYKALDHYQRDFTDEGLGGGNHFLSIEEDENNL